MKIAPVENNPGMFLFQCPGCGNSHGVWTDAPNARTGAKWGWNGSMDRPTFTPSILVQGTQNITDDEHRRLMAGEKVEPRPLRCHSYVTDGRIQFLGDCLHALAGQTIDLPDWDL
jgi:hypothetical protein